MQHYIRKIDRKDGDSVLEWWEKSGLEIITGDKVVGMEGVPIDIDGRYIIDY